MMRRQDDDDDDNEGEPNLHFFYIDAFMPGVIVHRVSMI